VEHAGVVGLAAARRVEVGPIEDETLAVDALDRRLERSDRRVLEVERFGHARSTRSTAISVDVGPRENGANRSWFRRNAKE
jgi:hypothetical protein